MNVFVSGSNRYPNILDAIGSFGFTPNFILLGWTDPLSSNIWECSSQI